MIIGNNNKINSVQRRRRRGHSKPEMIGGASLELTFLVTLVLVLLPVVLAAVMVVVVVGVLWPAGDWATSPRRSVTSTSFAFDGPLVARPLFCTFFVHLFLHSTNRVPQKRIANRATPMLMPIANWASKPVKKKRKKKIVTNV